MNEWDVTWMDGNNMRITRVQAYDLYVLINALSSFGVYNQSGVLKVERVASR